ncbi:MAG: peptide deformylase [bacterium]
MENGKFPRIVLYGNPVLRAVARQITEFNPSLEQLCKDLLLTMVKKDGVGLAANQIGIPLSIFALNPQACDIDRPALCIVNPEIVASEGKCEGEEGCLSFPGIFEIVSRPEFVRIKGLNVKGKSLEMEASGLMARAIFHEIDHLRGVLFIDHISELRRRLLLSRLKQLEEKERLFADNIL